MTLWLLRPTEPIQQPPWPDPIANCALGFVVRAENAEDARLLASAQCLDEGSKAWESDINSTCVEIEINEGAGVIIADYRRT